MATLSIRCLNVKLKYHLKHGDTLRVESENNTRSLLLSVFDCIRLSDRHSSVTQIEIKISSDNHLSDLDSENNIYLLLTALLSFLRAEKSIK